MIPYGQKILSDFLRDHAAVAALGARVVSKTPGTTSAPWVRVTKLDTRNETGSEPEHLLDFLFQLDCYAGAEGGLPEASFLGRTVRAALTDDLKRADLAEAVVTAVTIVGDANLPDAAFEPARDRVVLTASIYLHPVAVAS